MIDFLLVVLSILLAIPVLVLFIQAVMASTAPVTRINKTRADRVKIVVLVPAHNEESVISETIIALKAQLREGDRLVVIADNCSDDTAAIAIDLDAEVVNRTDEEKRGKGYALDFGINHIKQDDKPPEVVVVIDADCIVLEDCLDGLATQCIQTGRPAQAVYLMKSDSDKLGQKIAEFAWIVKNQVRSLGYFNLGLPCQLTGTGMAFPYHLIVEADLANADLVEDMKLGIDMARKGHSPLLCPGATVLSRFPSEERGISSQRTRWEHGHLGTILSDGPSLLTLAIKKSDFKLLAMALDLMVPPLALLSILLTVALALSGIFYLLSDNNLPFLINLGAGILFTLSVLLALKGFARHVLSLKDLLGVPVYIARKIPLYFRFLTRRQKDWIRTDRDGNV